MKKLALLLLFAAASGCITLTPKGRDVKVTENAADVEGCKSLGKIRPDAPYLLRSEAINLMKNRAAEDGADFLLLTGSGWERGDTATEYDCAKKKSDSEK